MEFGKILRFLRMNNISRLCAPQSNIRVALTHCIKPTDMEHYHSIIQLFSKMREIISPDVFFEFYAPNYSHSIDGKVLLLTFDDGLYSSYLAAKEVLSKYKIKAIFFIPTKILELKNKEEMLEFMQQAKMFKPKNNLSEAEYVTMTKENILELKEQGHWILPHTHTHCNLANIVTQDLVYSELIRPKLILEDLLKVKIDAFALTYGTEKEISAFAFRQIKSIYKFCFSNLIGTNDSKTNRYYFHRDSIEANFSLFHVQNIMDGVFDIYYRFKMKKLVSKTRDI